MTILDAIYLGNPLKNYILFLVFIFLGVFFGKLVRIITTKYLRALAGKTKTKFDDILLDALDMPLIILIFAGFFWYGLNYLVLPQKIGILANEAINVVVTLSGVWFLVKFVDDFIIEFIAPLAEKSETKLDDHVIPPLRKLVRILIIVIGFLVMLDNIGYDITTLLAGLGIGGLAVALASKETVENFIAGILIIMDKPFGMGDWIKFGSSEGIVEEVGIRSTRIRTFDDSLIVVPNANILRTEIENFSAMRKRRVLINIGLTYDTPVEKLKRAKEINTPLTKNANAIFCQTIRRVCLASPTASAIFAGASVISTTSAVSMAASEPRPPMATPTSARAKTGASLIPSPTKATLLPSLVSARICSKMRTLSSGSNPA